MQIIKKILVLILFYLFSSFSISSSQENFLSLKKNKVNVRYGPTFESPIKYIYKKIDLPLKQIDKKENFRRIIDLKNNSGWIHISQLKKSSSIIILENKVLLNKPSNFSRPVARLEKGRLLVVKKCKKEWCNVKTENYSGWIKNNNIWGYSN